MKYTNIVYSIFLLLAAGYVYDKFKINIDRDDKQYELNIIKKYLLNESENFTIEQLSSITKPILWVHIDYQKNSRKWESFGSRNSNNLNQDYLYLTIRSIIKHNNEDFHIILLDDDSFGKLLENWNVDLNKISGVQKDYFRSLGLVKILYNYGGLLLEPSFVIFKSLKPIYDKILSSQKMSVAEFPNNSSNAHIMNMVPGTNFMGCVKQCPVLNEFKNHLEIIAGQDYTNESVITDSISKWLFNKTQEQKINYIDGKFIGTRDSKNKMIDLEKLLGSTYLDLNVETYGLYIPKNDLLKRNNYNWFAYLNSKEVLESNTNIGKYLLLSNN